MIFLGFTSGNNILDQQSFLPPSDSIFKDSGSEGVEQKTSTVTQESNPREYNSQESMSTVVTHEDSHNGCCMAGENETVKALERQVSLLTEKLFEAEVSIECIRYS